MNKPPAKPPKALGHFRSGDLKALAQLATQATVNISHIAEGVHQSVWRTLGAPSGTTRAQARGLTGMVYRSVRGITQLVAKGLDLSLGRLQPALAPWLDAAPESPQREAVLAALNGVMGDHLVARGNALATPMTLRWKGQNLDWNAPPPAAQVQPKVLLLAHGLCMNDLQWRSTANGVEHDHGQALAHALGYTPVYLRYNTGLHTSENGAALHAALTELVQHWPVPVQEISMVLHSMGGLVARSAVHCASSQALSWTPYLKKMVFLGTPHHGAPLERAGNWVDLLLDKAPYAKPFAKLGQLRSAGITDLRHGNVRPEDWLGMDRFQHRQDMRLGLALPTGVDCFAVAATLSPPSAPARWGQLRSDGLVPVNSALGRHKDAQKALHIPADRQWVAYQTNHMQLLSSTAVTAQLLHWLS